VIHLPGPLHNRKVGVFNMISEDKTNFKFSERLSSMPKEKFIFEETRDFDSCQGDVISFVDENYMVSDFKTEHKKMYLFGVSRKLKENIYMNYWTP
jgi:hypothetical protein